MRCGGEKVKDLQFDNILNNSSHLGLNSRWKVGLVCSPPERGSNSALLRSPRGTAAPGPFKGWAFILTKWRHVYSFYFHILHHIFFISHLFHQGSPIGIKNLFFKGVLHSRWNAVCSPLRGGATAPSSGQRGELQPLGRFKSSFKDWAFILTKWRHVLHHITEITSTFWLLGRVSIFYYLKCSLTMEMVSEHF